VVVSEHASIIALAFTHRDPGWVLTSWNSIWIVASALGGPICAVGTSLLGVTMIISIASWRIVSPRDESVNGTPRASGVSLGEQPSWLIINTCRIFYGIIEIFNCVRARMEMTSPTRHLWLLRTIAVGLVPIASAIPRRQNLLLFFAFLKLRIRIFFSFIIIFLVIFITFAIAAVCMSIFGREALFDPEGLFSR